MKDVWGHELLIGDKVCVVRRRGRYIDNVFGTIAGFTPAGTLAHVAFDDGTGFFKARERIFKRDEDGPALRARIAELEAEANSLAAGYEGLAVPGSEDYSAPEGMEADSGG